MHVGTVYPRTREVDIQTRIFKFRNAPNDFASACGCRCKVYSKYHSRIRHFNVGIATAFELFVL